MPLFYKKRGKIPEDISLTKLICIFIILLINPMVSQHRYPASSLSMSAPNINIADQLIIDKNQNDIEVNYPEFNGLNNGQDAVVNALIKDNIYETVSRLRDSMYEGYHLFMSLDFEVKHLSDNFISICYTGWKGALTAGRGYTDCLYTLNIDVKQGKIVSKDDIFSNKKQIYELLTNNKFESITTIDGVKGGYPFSFFANEIDFIDSKEGIDSPNFKYYINGNNLVIVFSESNGYHEYSIEINKVKKYINEDVLKLIQE